MLCFVLFCFFGEGRGGCRFVFLYFIFLLAEKSVLCTTNYAYLYLFILQVQPNSPSLLYNTVLELYLHDIVHEKDISVRYIIYLYTNTLEGSLVY